MPRTPFAVLPAALVLCATVGTAHAGDATIVHAPLVGAQGQAIGTAVLEQTPAGVLITVEAEGLSAGDHGFHVHAAGVCDATAKFASAGGHFSPGKAMHGFKDAMGPHPGDMPNLTAGADGKVRAQVLNTAITLGKGTNSIADADGSALVIHGAADDYASQPAGNAGDRAACAVIAAPKS